MNEKMMQEIIGKYPSEALGEEGLISFDKEAKIGDERLNLVLKDRMGRLLMLKVQEGPLDPGNIDRHIDFCMKFVRSNPYYHIRIMFVANHLSTLQKDFLHQKGYEFRELSQKRIEEIVEKYGPHRKDPSMSNIEKRNIHSHSEKKNMIRILILEDDPSSGKLLTNFLEPYGNCDLVTDGKSAVEFFQKAIRADDGYKLILVDIMVPETLGHDVVRMIRETEIKEGIPLEKRAKVIMTTSLSDPDNIIEAFKANCDSYLIKPIRKAKLINELKALGLSIDSDNNIQ
jgi:two-component system chemotaxis response regulator CheY